MLQNGKTLSMHSNSVYKGDCSHNGTLLKLHENAYTIGYSALLSPDGSSAGKVKFGDGVWYDANQKNNKVYVGAPTVADAVPVFAGIMVREPGIASGYPVLNDEVADFQKDMLAKEGYIVYKEAYVGSTYTEKKNLFNNASVTLGTNMYVRELDGTVYFASAKVDNDDALVGKVVEFNPDDESVTVYINPAFVA